MEFINKLPNAGNCLVVSNACGAGHIQATESIEKAITVRNKAHKKALNVFTIDFLKASVGNWIGQKSIDSWNGKQKREDVAAINKYLNYQWAEEWFLGIIVFFAFLFQLSKYNVDTVITAQPLGIKAIIRAVRVRNWFNRCFYPSRKQIQVTMVMTDLPTEKTRNFLPPIKRLSANDRKVFKLVTMKPLLAPGQSQEQFWNKFAGLSLKKGEVYYDGAPVRRAFRELDPAKEIPQLSVKYASDEELKLMAATCGEALHRKAADGKIVFDISPDDKVISLMLGGHACVEATKQYVQNLMRCLSKPGVSQQKHYLYVYCGKHGVGEKASLFKQIHDLVQAERLAGRLPNNLHVVPVTYQGDDEIAPMMARSNLTITKSGGLTAMEVHKVVQKKIFLHATLKGATETTPEEELMDKGMPVWEAGNADYLRKMKGAAIVTPQTISGHDLSDL